MLKVLWSVMMALPLLSSGCGSVPIHDYQFCSPIPGNLGAACDNLLTANQIILSEPEWVAMQAQWAKEGKATECTQSDTLGDIKAEIEKLCSVARCDYPTQKKITEGLEKLQALGKSHLH